MRQTPNNNTCPADTLRAEVSMELTSILYWRIQECRRQVQHLQELQWSAGYSEVRVSRIAELQRIINNLTR